MNRPTASFARKKPSLDPAPTILVICEDTKSSKDYLEDAAIHFRVNAKILVSHCGRTDTAGIVNQAIASQNKYDHTYCVVDRDSHPNWEAAVNRVYGNDKITIIPSYPCFEYWLLSHFTYSRKPFVATGNKSPGDSCVGALKQHGLLNQYDKGRSDKLFNTLLPHLPTAERHARMSLRDAEQSNAPNPSTRIHLLMDFFRNLQRKYTG